MRDVREVMRLYREGCVPTREIARMHGLAHSTVRDMIVRFDRSGLAWPIPPEISDTDVAQHLYGASGVKPGRRKCGTKRSTHVLARLFKSGLSLHAATGGSRPCSAS